MFDGYNIIYDSHGTVSNIIVPYSKDFLSIFLENYRGSQNLVIALAEIFEF